jgi:hypothetical protein
LEKSPTPNPSSLGGDKFKGLLVKEFLRRSKISFFLPSKSLQRRGQIIVYIISNPFNIDSQMLLFKIGIYYNQNLEKSYKFTEKIFIKILPLYPIGEDANSRRGIALPRRD